MLVRSKFFSQFVEKIEKLKLSLSKQNNKMLKIRSEMLKIRKNDKLIKLEKNSREHLPKIFRIPKIPRISGIPGNFFENSSFLGKFKIREKGNPNLNRTLVLENELNNGSFIALALLRYAQ